MANNVYNMSSPSHYPFNQEKAKLFSQELIEYVLFDFGHVWTPERSKRETELRKNSSFVFLQSIGRLTAYISRKYSAFIMMKCFGAWKYVNSHRSSVKKELLRHEIINLCTQHKVDDDLSLFAFLAIVAEYARLVITHGQEYLVDAVVDALSYCLLCELYEGFISTWDRLKRRASIFKYPKNSILCDYDPQTGFLAPVSTDPMYTHKSDHESPITLEFNLPPSLYNTTREGMSEEIIAELKKRKVHKELFRLKMMTDRATQTEIKNVHDDRQLRCYLSRSTQPDLAEKIEIIKESSSDSPIPEAKFIIIQTSNVSVQTRVSKKGHISKDPQSANKYVLDTDVVTEKLEGLSMNQEKDPLPSTSTGIVNSEIKSDDIKGASEVKNLSQNETSEKSRASEEEAN